MSTSPPKDSLKKVYLGRGSYVWCGPGGKVILKQKRKRKQIDLTPAQQAILEQIIDRVKWLRENGGLNAK